VNWSGYERFPYVSAGELNPKWSIENETFGIVWMNDYFALYYIDVRLAIQGNSLSSAHPMFYIF